MRAESDWLEINVSPLRCLAGAFWLTVGLIRTPEPAVIPEQHPDMRREIVSGLKDVWQMPLLRASAMATLVFGLAQGILGALVVLYTSRGLGFNPGLLGVIWAIGGVCSFIGATLAPRITHRLGSGPAMILGLGMFGLSLFLIPLAHGASLMSALLLVAQQFGDGFCVVHEINQVSFRQAVTSGRVLGRVNATFQFLNLGTILIGSLLAGLLGEVLGVRTMLVFGCCCSLLAVLLLAASPLRRFRMGAKSSMASA
ncbi:MAG TPA: MFS transporter [Verrucomicrobiae bacterium]|nr:MFS transporter [Verrucomicrobiae bacterium]